MPKPFKELLLNQCECQLLWLNRIAADCGLISKEAALDSVCIDAAKPIFDTIKHYADFDDQ